MFSPAMSNIRWTTCQLFWLQSRKRHPNLAIRRYRVTKGWW